MAAAPKLSIVPIDTMLFGEPRVGCSYLLRGRRTALVDCGTAAGAPRLLDLLQGARLDFLFLTHAHLDHSGAAGHIAAVHPKALVVAHPQATPHLADPSRLVAAVRAASPDLATLYGEPLPIDARRLVSVEDRQIFPLDRSAKIVAILTPGHAPHHVAFFEPSTGVLFVGDAVGHHGAPIDLPLSVPPRFDVAASRASIERLASLEPQTLAFAHFGLAEDASACLAAYPREVDAWLGRIAALRNEHGEDAVPDIVLGEARHRSLTDVQKHVVRLCVCGALLTVAADRGPVP